MDKKELVILMLVLVPIFMFIGFLFADIFLMERGPVIETPDYVELQEQCRSSEDTNCCLNSLDIMRENEYFLMHEEYGCPEDYSPNMLACISSLRWCEPIEE
ncbi:MAG: hypothetical protein ACOCRX_00115 [Candidatus Woesearchaeota archaeon]